MSLIYDISYLICGGVTGTSSGTGRLFKNTINYIYIIYQHIQKSLETSEMYSQSPKSRSTSSVPGTQQYYFMFFPRWVITLQPPQSYSPQQLYLRLRFQVHRGQQMINNIKQPIQVQLFSEGTLGHVEGYRYGGKIERCQICFFVKNFSGEKDSKDGEFVLKIYARVSSVGEQYDVEDLIGEVGLNVGKYVKKFTDDSINQIEQQVEFSRTSEQPYSVDQAQSHNIKNNYKLGYTIFTDTTRHALQKVVKNYQSSQEYGQMVVGETLPDGNKLEKDVSSPVRVSALDSNAGGVTVEDRVVINAQGIMNIDNDFKIQGGNVQPANTQDKEKQSQISSSRKVQRFHIQIPQQTPSPAPQHRSPTQSRTPPNFTTSPQPQTSPKPSTSPHQQQYQFIPEHRQPVLAPEQNPYHQNTDPLSYEPLYHRPLEPRQEFEGKQVKVQKALGIQDVEDRAVKDDQKSKDVGVEGRDRQQVWEENNIGNIEGNNNKFQPQKVQQIIDIEPEPIYTEQIQVQTLPLQEPQPKPQPDQQTIKQSKHYNRTKDYYQPINRQEQARQYQLYQRERKRKLQQQMERQREKEREIQRLEKQPSLEKQMQMDKQILQVQNNDQDILAGVSQITIGRNSYGKDKTQKTQNLASLNITQQSNPLKKPVYSPKSNSKNTETPKKAQKHLKNLQPSDQNIPQKLIYSDTKIFNPQETQSQLQAMKHQKKQKGGGIGFKILIIFTIIFAALGFAYYKGFLGSQDIAKGVKGVKNTIKDVKTAFAGSKKANKNSKKASKAEKSETKNAKKQESAKQKVKQKIKTIKKQSKSQIKQAIVKKKGKAKSK